MFYVYIQYTLAIVIIRKLPSLWTIHASLTAGLNTLNADVATGDEITMWNKVSNPMRSADCVERVSMYSVPVIYQTKKI